MRNTVRLLAAAVVMVSSVSCGDVVRDGSSPTFVVMESLQASRGGPQPGTPSGFLISDVITNVTAPAPCTPERACPTIFGDSGVAVLRLVPRDVTNATAPTTNNEVTINRVHVEYIRADGRNTPGVDVPFPFDGAVTATIPTQGSMSLGFELVRNIAKQESPLVQLATSPNIITTIARVTFFGQDRTGNVQSVTGQIQIDFGNFGDF